MELNDFNELIRDGFIGAVTVFAALLLFLILVGV